MFRFILPFMALLQAVFAAPAKGPLIQIEDVEGLPRVLRPRARGRQPPITFDNSC